MVGKAGEIKKKKLGKGSLPLLLFSEADVRAIRESLADFVCSRCKRMYRDHWDADHFFEYAEDFDPDKVD